MTVGPDRFSVQKLAEQFRLLGWIGLWSQVVLGIIAGVMAIVGTTVEKAGSAGLSGIPFTFVGLVSLFVSAYWAFRYTRLSRQLRASDSQARPSRAETIALLRKGLLTTLIGLIFTAIGSEAISGVLFTKSLNAGIGIVGLANTDPSRYIQPVDVFIVLANTHIFTAHVISLTASLWLLNRVIR
ncbi:MAG: DUF3611 family protein [Synechococcales cyanobacterium RM1_1_8]|nr:DUF3611 family protein [Synechococcales cyanobacterium RM1_1_8]